LVLEQRADISSFALRADGRSKSILGGAGGRGEGT